MQMLKAWGITALVVVLAGCTQSTPAPVVSGYNGNLEVEKQPVVQEQKPVVAKPVALNSPSRAEGRVTYEDIEPAGGPAQPAAAVAKASMVKHTVQPMDTVYSLASQYESSVDDILKTNHIAATDLRVGQVLEIPANSHPRVSAWEQMKAMLQPPASAAQPRAVVAQNIADVEPAAGAAAPPAGMRYSLTREKMVPVAKSAEVSKVAVAESEEKSLASVEPAAGVAPQTKLKSAVTLVDHQVVAGETIYRISKAYDASVLDIMSANDFEKPQDLKAGTIVKVPVNQDVALKNTADDGVVARTPVSTAKKEISDSDKPGQPEAKAQVKVAEVKDAEEIAGQSSGDTDEAVAETPVKDTPTNLGDELRAEMKRGQVDPVAAKAVGKVWPVRGTILKRFGEEGNGVAHTGINIAVPVGTPVLATDNGTVLYADDGLKTYGKLVLIRHDSGMVSAYAHNSHLLVRKGEKVKKGQIIAASGASGNVDKPQLHFELRRHASAIDPLRELPKL
ncbi:MAG: peptidoglycan DD-metalloendopeptidase family protein [Proteobacteria bacterium]|nr:peptidoglycan DD-metalloendopeptidase family protein [Pseudomonadota bacterium]